MGKSRAVTSPPGHTSGRHIVEILKTKRGDLTDADFAHIRKVVGYAKRHLSQRPHGKIDEPVAILLDELGPRPREVLIVPAGCG